MAARRRPPTQPRLRPACAKARQGTRGVTGTPSGPFGVYGCPKSAVRHAPDSVAGAIMPGANSIKAMMGAKTTPVNTDEAPYSALGDTCQRRAATDPDSAVVEMAASRGTIVLGVRFPRHSRSVTSDGLAPYSTFVARRRCWAHVLRRLGRHIGTIRKMAGVLQTGCRNAQMPRKGPQQLCHEAKSMGTAAAQQCGAPVKRLPEAGSPFCRMRDGVHQQRRRKEDPIRGDTPQDLRPDRQQGADGWVWHAAYVQLRGANGEPDLCRETDRILQS